MTTFANSMRTSVITLSSISILLTVLYFTLASQPVSGQLVNMHTVLENHVKSFNQNGNLAQLPIVIVEKMISIGSNLVAFNPNHGDSKVITMLTPTG